QDPRAHQRGAQPDASGAADASRIRPSRLRRDDVLRPLRAEGYAQGDRRPGLGRDAADREEGRGPGSDEEGRGRRRRHVAGADGRDGEGRGRQVDPGAEDRAGEAVACSTTVQTMSSNLLPLAGVRVIEVCNVAAGPFCGMLLADMGADVIKVENPDGGDTLRSWPPINDGYSENFASLNRNKRSVTLNLKDAGDVELLRRLATTAQVLIENNRPGVMDRLGVGYGALRELNRALIYCSI